MQNVITFNFYRGVVELVSRLDNECDELILRVVGGYGAVIWHDDQRVTVASDDFRYMIAAKYWTGEGTLKIEIRNAFTTYSFEIEKTATTDGVYLNQLSEFGYKLSNKTETAESYDDLKNKPSINGVKLGGDKTSEQLGLLPEDTDRVTHAELSASLETKQDKLTAGKGINIEGSLISADGSGGSEVSITPTLHSGQKIADYEIDGTSGEIYAPSGQGITTYYLTHGLVGDTSETYITCPLDLTMTDGLYIALLYDGNKRTAVFFFWFGETITLNIESYSYFLQITSTTAGLTSWSGAWRDIYCDIIKFLDL